MRRLKRVAAFYQNPIFRAFPVPTIIAVGVARPSAQGQAITRTEINIDIATSNDLPAISHPAKAITAITNTAGTK
jgi:hypothetical protein